MKKEILIVLLGILIVPVLKAQTSLTWGKPSEEEIQIKVCPFDSSANAVILAENGTISYLSGFIHIKVYRKIKILNPKGLDYGNVEIPYYVGSSIDDIQNLKAQTINIENGNRTTIDLKNGEIYNKVVSPNVHEKAFAFPSVKPGSILEYKYTLVTKRLAFLKGWEFQHLLPVIYSEVQVNLPDFLKYSVLLFGDRLREKYEGKTNKKNIWTLKNIPGFESENHVFCYQDYIDQIQFQLVSYESYSGTKDFLHTWEELGKEAWENHQLYLSRNGAARNLLSQILNGGESREGKIRKIFNYVYNFNGKNYFIEARKGFNELIESKSGNSAEVNLLLCLLLNEAGIPAHPVLISTKPNGKVIKNYPMGDQFDHVLVAVEENNSYKFLDAKSSSGNAYLVPHKHVNYFGYLVNATGGKWIELDYPVVSKENVLVNCRLGDVDSKIEVTGTYSGYFAEEKRNEYKNNKVEEPEYFISNVPMKKDSASVKNLEDEYQDVVETFYFSNTSDHPNNKLILDLNILNDENPFNQKTRMFPVEINYPFSKQYIFSIKLQPDDTIKILPKNLSMNLENEGVRYGRFSYKASRLPNKLLVTIQLEMDKTIFPKDFYEYLKEYFNRLILKLNEPIVIEKK